MGEMEMSIKDGKARIETILVGNSVQREYTSKGR
jgi:hypothetical protein